jgi:hypothetical protein
VESRETGSRAFLGCSEHGTHRPYLRLTPFRRLTTHNEYCSPAQLRHTVVLLTSATTSHFRLLKPALPP